MSSDGGDTPGDIVWVNCGHPLEDSHSTGKWRPMLLVRRVGGHWMAVGLTTRQKYADGTDRVSIPNPKAVGLSGAGYIWGENLTRISVLDIGSQIGRADIALLLQVEASVRLNDADRQSLRHAV